MEAGEHNHKREDYTRCEMPKSGTDDDLILFVDGTRERAIESLNLAAATMASKWRFDFLGSSANTGILHRLGQAIHLVERSGDLIRPRP